MSVTLVWRALPLATSLWLELHGLSTWKKVPKHFSINQLSANNLWIHLSSDFVTTNTGGTFEEFIIPSADLVSSRWNKYIYRVYRATDGDANIHTCKAMCVFDSDNIGTRNGSEIISFTKVQKMCCHNSRGENKVLFVLLSRTQAEPGRIVKQEQEEISRNHVQTFISPSVVWTLFPFNSS